MDKTVWNRVLRNKSSLTRDEFALLSKYRARSLYSRNLRQAHVEQLSKATADSYLVMLRLSLAYTAIEMLDTATGSGRGIKIQDQSTSRALESGFLDALIEAIRKSTPKDKLTKVNDSLSLYKHGLEVNLLYFAEFCRHLMFHGAFSPNETKLTSSIKRRALIAQLTISMLDAGDSHLNSWLSKKIQKFNRQS